MKLAPSAFTWEKYIGKLGFATTDIFKNPYSGNPPILKADVTYIGYCDASKIQIRQRSEGYVFMVIIDGEETWLHAMDFPSNIPPETP